MNSKHLRNLNSHNRRELRRGRIKKRLVLKELSLDYNRGGDKTVGVLVVNLNNIELTRGCLDSLSSQVNQNFKTYLIDQNSDEKGTDKFLKEYENKGVIVHKNNTNVPLNHVWNEFKSKCNCDYLCYLNNDVVLSHFFIDDTIRILDSEPSVGAVIHVTNHHQYLKSGNLNYKIMSVYQGWDFTLRRDIIPTIPESLKVFGGDDYLFAKIRTAGYKTAMVYSSPIIHYKEKTRVNIPDIKQIQDNDKKVFGSLISTEGLKTMRHTVGAKICKKFPTNSMGLSHNKNCIFTALIGDYDNLCPTDYPRHDDWDYICFTDNKDIKSDFWRMIYVPGVGSTPVDNIRRARYFKTNFHKYLSVYENLLWVDARITVTESLNDYLKNLNDCDIVFLKHPNARNISEEFRRVVSGKLEKADVAEAIRKRYEEAGYKYDNGMIASGVILFKNNGRTVKFFKDWWSEIENFSVRDQLSANFAIWKNPGMKYNVLSNILNKRYFKQLPRKTKRFFYE